MQSQPSGKISLRKFVPEDAEKIFRMSREDSLVRFLPDQVYRDEQEAAEVLAHLITAYTAPIELAQQPFVLGVVLGGMELIGHVGLSQIEQGIEIGYAIEQKHQGRGYAREAVSLMVHFAETNTRLPKIYGIVDPENKASVNVLEKCGFTRVEEMQCKLVYRKILIHT
jgi:ribosomal-protein-alanine N-acetyltransferase